MTGLYSLQTSWAPLPLYHGASVKVRTRTLTYPLFPPSPAVARAVISVTRGQPRSENSR